MTLRFSTSQVHRQAVTSLLDVQKQVSATQQQIATGKRVQTPGDDPVAATRILQLTQDLRLGVLYDSNATTLQNRLEREDVALTSIGDLLQKAQELVIQAGNAALDAEQRGFIAVEMRGVTDSMVQIMNSRDANGEFLFAGLQSSQTPFVKGVDGFYDYRGDERSRQVQLSNDSYVQFNDSGQHLFVDLPSGETGIRLEQQAPNGRGAEAASRLQVSAPQVVNRSVFDDFYPSDAVLEFYGDQQSGQIASKYRVVSMPSGTVLQDEQDYISGSAITFAGVSLHVSGVPQQGESVQLVSSDKQPLLNTLESFSRALSSLGDDSNSRETLNARIEATLGNLDLAQTRQLEVQSSVGSRLNQIDTTRNSNADTRLATQAALSELEDLDFAEAVSQLTHESFILEAAQASFARISGLSLFNFL